MKKNEVVTISVIALVVFAGGWLVMRPKPPMESPAAAASLRKPMEAERTPEPLPEREPVVGPEVHVADAKTEVKELRDEVAPERVSMAIQAQPDRASAIDKLSVYAPDAELKEGALPDHLLGFLDRELFPGSAETLRRREISISQERDGASLSLEEAIKNLIKSTLAVQPESLGMKYMVSCGVSLCEVQLEELAPGARGAAQTALNIKILSAFSSELVRGPSTYETKDTHPYVVSYWMRVGRERLAEGQ